MKFINLTPHVIHEVVTEQDFAPSGTIARVESETVEIDNLDGIVINSVTFGTVDLPEQIKDTMYIVSGMVLSAISDRDDVVAPGELVRDDSGRPVGCCGFRR